MSTDALHYEFVNATTADAVLLDLGDGECPVWIPRSVIEDGDAIQDGDGPDDLEVKTWFLKKEGLL